MNRPVRALLLADATREDQPFLMRNLADAMRACGDKPETHVTRRFDVEKAYDRYDMVCAWGWRKLESYRNQRLNVLVIERGFVGDRFQWYSAGWNGLNGRAVFPLGPSGFTRWAANTAEFEKLRVQPAVFNGQNRKDYVLLLGQVPSDTAIRTTGIKFLRWARDVTEALRARGHRHILYRPHPNAPMSRPVGAHLIGGTLSDALMGAQFAVSYNSTAGVDAVLAGVPSLVYDVGSMAWSVSGHGPNEEARFVSHEQELVPWKTKLAWAQWRMHEFRDPATWTIIKNAVF